MVEKKINLYEEFADKQVVDDLIKEVAYLRTQIKVIREDVILVEEGFIKENGKLLKQIRVNKANHFLLEDNFNNLVLKVDLIDKRCRN